MPARYAVAIYVIFGLLLGLGGYTFIYARGASYMTNDPNACANCHIMREQFEGWQRSSHRSVAVCNDCHAPHDLIGKYMTKARNGFWHSFYFTTGTFHEPIQDHATQCRGDRRSVSLLPRRDRPRHRHIPPTGR